MATEHELCPRLIDYIVFVGCTSWSGDSNVSQVPDILRRYPPEDHHDKTLPIDVVYFCQPEGCLTTRHKSIFSRPLAPFVFTLTEKDSGLVRFGVCLNFYRQFNSSAATIEETNDTVNHLEKSEFSNSNTNTTVKRKKRNPFTLTSICFISHHPFFSKFRECLFFLKRLLEYTQKVFFVENKHTANQAHFWDAFFGESSNTNNNLKDALIDIETWIFKFLSISTPSPGKTFIKVDIFPRELSSQIFAYPSGNRLSLVDFPVHLPLELLGVELCLKVLICVVLEQKVVIRSRNYNALSMTVLGLTAMIYPLQYMFPVIPLLPTSMSDAEQLLLAPTPYLIGIPTCFLNHHKKFNLPDDVCLVDLDTTSIRYSQSLPKPPKLPEPEGPMLVNTLKEILSKMSAIHSSNETKTNQPLPSKSEKYGSDMDSLDVNVRVALIRFFSSQNVLGRFEDHVRILRLYPRPVVAFCCNTFLDSRTTQSEFTEYLSQTQAVEFLAEWLVSNEEQVLSRINSGVTEPSEIGDKYKWYQSDLKEVKYTVWNPKCPIFQKNPLPLDNDESPAIEIAVVVSDGGTTSGEETKKIVAGASHQDHVDKIIDNRVAMQLSKYRTLLSVKMEDVFRPAVKFVGVEPDKRLQTLDDTSLTKSGVQTSMMVKSQPSKPLSPAGGPKAVESSAISNLSYTLGQSAANASSLLQNFLNSQRNMESVPLTSPTKLKQKSTSEESKEAQNQTFLYELVDTVILSGEIAGLMVRGRTKRLYEEEKNRIYSLKQVFQYFDSSISETSEFMHEVAIIDKNGYYALSWLLTQMIQGIEKHYNQPTAHAQNGMGSVFVILEIMHTFFQMKNNSQLQFSVFASNQIFGANNKRSVVGTVADWWKEITHDFHLPLVESDYQGVEVDSHISASSRRSSIDNDSHIEVKEMPALSDNSLKQEVKDPDHSAVTDTKSGTPLVLNGEEYENIDIYHAMAAGEEHDDLGKDMGRWENLDYVDNSHLMTLSDKNYTEELDIQGTTKAKRQPLIPMRPLVYMAKSRFTDGYRYLRDNVVEVTPPDDGHMRTYMFEAFVEKRERNALWNSMEFWEDSFYDAVVQERAILSMEQTPKEMLTRYFAMPIHDKKRLEFDEDRLLGIMLHNMIAFMVMMKLEVVDIKRKVRRLVAKSHIGLLYSQKINNLLDQLHQLHGNDIDMKPLISRTLKRYVYTVNVGLDANGQTINLVVSEDCLVLRSTSGEIIDRWWFEILLNMTFSSKSKVLRIWLRENDHSQLYSFYTRRCKQLYLCVEEAMKKAAQKAKKPPLATDVGRKFLIEARETKKKGYCIVSLEGIMIEFADSMAFIPLSNIKRCYPKKDLFTIEEYDPDTKTLKSLTYRCEESNILSSKIEQAVQHFKAQGSSGQKLISFSSENEASDDTLCVTDPSEASELIDGPFRKSCRGKSMLMRFSSEVYPPVSQVNINVNKTIIPISLTLPFELKAPTSKKPSKPVVKPILTKKKSNLEIKSPAKGATFNEEINVENKLS